MSKNTKAKKTIKRSMTKIKRTVGVLKKAKPTAVIPLFTVIGVVAGIIFENLILWLGIAVAIGIILAYFVQK